MAEKNGKNEKNGGQAGDKRPAAGGAVDVEFVRLVCADFGTFSPGQRSRMPRPRAKGLEAAGAVRIMEG